MRLTILTAVMASLAAPAFAGPKTKVSVLFQDFPQGTRCGVSGAVGKVKTVLKGGHPKVDVIGNGEVGDFFCKLPDGHVVWTDVNKRLPENTRFAGVTVYPDGRTFVTSSTAAGLIQQQYANTLR